jgi:hypothetical protein
MNQFSLDVMKRIALAITFSMSTVAAASPQSELNRPSAFEIRELKSGSEVHEEFPCANNDILCQPKFRNLAATAALDTRALEGVRIRPLTGNLAGYFDIDVVFTDAGAIAYDRFCAIHVDTGIWAYLLSGTVVSMHSIGFHRSTEHPAIGTGLHTVLTETEARQYAAAVKSEIESLRH